MHFMELNSKNRMPFFGPKEYNAFLRKLWITFTAWILIDMICYHIMDEKCREFRRKLFPVLEN